MWPPQSLVHALLCSASSFSFTQVCVKGLFKHSKSVLMKCCLQGQYLLTEQNVENMLSMRSCSRNNHRNYGQGLMFSLKSCPCPKVLGARQEADGALCPLSVPALMLTVHSSHIKASSFSSRHPKYLKMTLQCSQLPILCKCLR